MCLAVKRYNFFSKSYADSIQYHSFTSANWWTNMLCIKIRIKALWISIKTSDLSISVEIGKAVRSFLREAILFLFHFHFSIIKKTLFSLRYF